MNRAGVWIVRPTRIILYWTSVCGVGVFVTWVRFANARVLPLSPLAWGVIVLCDGAVPGSRAIVAGLLQCISRAHWLELHLTLCVVPGSGALVWRDLQCSDRFNLALLQVFEYTATTWYDLVRSVVMQLRCVTQIHVNMFRVEWECVV